MIPTTSAPNEALVKSAHALRLSQAIIAPCPLFGEDVPSLGKTGTKLADLPTNVQIIPRAIINQQGDTMLRRAITNASGVNQGGQDSLGYFDHCTAVCGLAVTTGSIAVAFASTCHCSVTFASSDASTPSAR